MKTTKEKIAVMQAHEDGKGIRMALLENPDHWAESFYPAWNWEKIDYEVEPEPMVIYKVKEGKVLYSNDHLNLESADLWAHDFGIDNYEIIKFVEDMSCTTK